MLIAVIFCLEYVQAEAGGSGIVARRLTGQAGSDHFVMKIPNNKVIRKYFLSTSLIIGLIGSDKAPDFRLVW